MEQHIFSYFIYYEGTTKKVVVNYIATELNLHKNVGFVQQKCILEF
jgi:hypothetical protein